MQTLFWHDYETFGADPWRDRPVQFAGIRTNLDLEIVDEPVMFFGKPPREMPPHPEACLITGITPQQAEREGVIEAEFAARVHEQLAQPGTCGVGYNSLRFDDEVTRQLLYRNMYEPYGREWENGNSRWDLIDLVRMCQALRPEGIVWPTREDGTPSFKLEHLAAANHLQQERAHDALSDVHALIDLARLIRVRQPRLWDWYFGLRRKQRVFELLDFATMTPVVHVSSRYPSSRHCLTVVVPLAAHPSRPAEIIVYDLTCDPSQWLALDEEEIADRVFTARADLPEGVTRIPLRTVRANRAPALAPLSVLQGVDLDRLQLDLAQIQSHRDMLASNFIGNLTGLYARELGDVPFRRIGHEDYAFWLEQVRRAGAAVRADSAEPLAWYLVRESSLSANKLRAARWQWTIYRQVEKLGLLRASLCMLRYVWHAFAKRRRPRRSP